MVVAQKMLLWIVPAQGVQIRAGSAVHIAQGSDFTVVPHEFEATQFPCEIYRPKFVFEETSTEAVVAHELVENLKELESAVLDEVPNDLT